MSGASVDDDSFVKGSVDGNAVNVFEGVDGSVVGGTDVIIKVASVIESITSEDDVALSITTLEETEPNVPEYDAAESLTSLSVA
jgi:hypothetical protein